MRISDWSSDVCSSDLIGGASRSGDNDTRGREILHLTGCIRIAFAVQAHAGYSEVGAWSIIGVCRRERDAGLALFDRLADHEAPGAIEIPVEMSDRPSARRSFALHPQHYMLTHARFKTRFALGTYTNRRP